MENLFKREFRKSDATVNLKAGRVKRGPSWKTATGERIPITELSNEHLINILNMLYKAKSMSKLRIRPLLAEARKRGLGYASRPRFSTL